ncbi:MAG TPA: FAD-binding oxidoreductase, partial [Turneriella sp.]|nr:FAD-binding oxidoreductase [Turneriella sp.]
MNPFPEQNKSWRHVYRWGDTDKKVDPTIQKHIDHFKHVFGIEGDANDTPLNVNAYVPVKLAKRTKLSRVALRDLMRIVGSEN